MTALPGPQEIPLAGDHEELHHLKCLRREFHAHPEIKWTEFRTTARICNLLKAMGFEVLHGKGLYDGELQGRGARRNLPDEDIMEEAFHAAGQIPVASHGACEENEGNGIEEILEEMRGGFTGVISHIAGRAGGPKLGFRFDMDALPITEFSTPDHFPCQEGFHSGNGNMHACGHDGHMAIGLGLAKRLAANIGSLSGDYYLFFQPAEEGGLGGKVFTESGLLKELDYFTAIHLGLIPARKVICNLSFMDSKRSRVEFRGRSAHSAVAPNEGRNALLAACDAVTSLYAISRHGQGASRVNVGSFRSSNAVNVVPDHATFEFQVRGENPDISRDMQDSAVRVVRGAAAMHDVEVEIKDCGYYISCPGSPDLKEEIRSAALRTGVPEDAIEDEHRVMGSEDCCYLMREVRRNGGQAAFIGLGSPTQGGHHTPDFDFDEDLMLWGVNILWELVKELSSAQ